MHKLITGLTLLSIFLLSIEMVSGQANHQKPLTNDVPGEPTRQPATKDTLREFEIIRGPSMRMMQTDSGTLQIIAGGAVVHQGGTKFYADSLILNNDTRLMESFGNVHINDGDSVNIYSQYLRYNGIEKYAFLSKKVKLTGRNGTLTTEELDYNLNSGIGNYYKGGKIINNENIIASKNGTYYADTRDVYFKKDVKMDGPKDHVRTDSLIYNMDDGNITFISETYVSNADMEMRTSEGRYDTNSGDAFFSSRTNIKDSSGRIYTANNMAMEGESGNAQLEGNALIIDSANGFMLISNQIFLNKKDNSFLAARQPVLIIKQDEDSTFIAADTIYSGLVNIKDQQETSSADSATQLHKQMRGNPDSLQITDSLSFEAETDITDSLALPEKKVDSVELPRLMEDSIQRQESIVVIQDSALLKDMPDKAILLVPLSKDTADKGLEPDTTANPSDTIRYFIAYHNVRVYNDSVQSVCDSLFISSQDSVFRMFREPVVWNGNTQITGDTMFLFTKNKEAERLYVYDRALVVNRTEEGFFNQMAGKTLNAYFKDNQFDSIRIRGSQAESVYYMQEEDSSYMGINKMTGDVIDMLFDKGELQKVIYINQVKGKMYPMGAIPEDEKFLKGFEWLDHRRPKNKAELFQ